jgi:hypothetical protein
MKLAEPQLLSEALAQGPFPVETALECALDLADGLRQVHEQGMVWGSLDADHVRIAGGHAKLLPPLPSEGRLAWPNPRYAAPERQAGCVDDPRSDVYALGVVWYEMLTGSLAGHAGPLDLKTEPLELALEGGGAPPPDLARNLNAVLAKCLARDLEYRWQRVQKVVLELKLLRLICRHAHQPMWVAPGPAAPVPETVVADLVPVAVGAGLLAMKAAAGVGSAAEAVALAPAEVREPEVAAAAAAAEPEPCVEEPVPLDGPATAAPPEGPATLQVEKVKDDKPSGIVCPKCSAPYVFPSRSRTHVESLLQRGTSRVFRCHRCYYRFARIGPFRMSKPR